LTVLAGSSRAVVAALYDEAQRALGVAGVEWPELQQHPTETVELQWQQ
jgi:hypothetical protein